MPFAERHLHSARAGQSPATFTALCLTTSLLLAACGDANGRADDGAVAFDTLPGGVIRVTNRTPVDSGRWSLVLDHTVQPDDESPGALRAPDDLLQFDDGTTLIADSKPTEVARFDASGRYLGRFGREGAGPGEYRSAWLAARGDTLVVQDPTLGRAVMFSLASAATMGQRMTTPRYYTKVFIDGSGRAVTPMLAARDSAAGPRQGFVRFSLDRAGIDTTFLPEHARGDARWIVREGKNLKFEMLVPLQPRDIHAVDPLGGFVTGWSGEFVLRTTRNGSDTVRLISRPDAGGVVSTAEKAAIVEGKIADRQGRSLA